MIGRTPAFARTPLFLIFESSSFFNIVLGMALWMVATVESIIVRISLRNYARFFGGSGRVGDVVVLGVAFLSMRAVVKVLVVVLL